MFIVFNCIFLVYTFSGKTVFQLTLITADRMLTIVYMNRFTFLKKQWFQWLMIFIGIAYNISINTPNIIYNHIVEVNQSKNSSVASFKLCTSGANLKREYY